MARMFRSINIQSHLKSMGKVFFYNKIESKVLSTSIVVGIDKVKKFKQFDHLTIFFRLNLYNNNDSHTHPWGDRSLHV